MSLWSRLRGAVRSAPGSETNAGEEPGKAPEGDPAATSPTIPAELTRLLTIGDAGGPTETEALGLFAELRRTPDEGLALDLLAQRSASHALPESFALAVAAALLDRGERGAAKGILARLDGTPALVVRADLLAEGADFAGAVATIERVLLRDLDLPGARERRLRWRERLGLGASERRVDPATMTVASPHGRTPFDLVREVARGGAGVVFEARDRELGRTVAVKVYHQAERDRGQLLHEGRVAAALEGRGVVQVLDIEPNEGWLALEWASLGALRDLLRRADDVDAAAALRPLGTWVPKLAAALARVHAAGWVHHDVKPANVLMSRQPGGQEDAEPWLADFGSARKAGETSPPGSMGYVSPERLAGRASDPRDDVYGFGRVLEEVLEVVKEDPDARRLRVVAAGCVAGGDGRPANGGALVDLLGRAQGTR